MDYKQVLCTLMEDCEEILTEEGPSEADKLSNIRQAIENIKKQMKVDQKAQSTRTVGGGGGNGGCSRRNGGTHIFSSPADRSADMSPPSKRIRTRDWDERYPNYELGGGHHSGGGGDGDHGGGDHGGGDQGGSGLRDSNGHDLDDEQTLIMEQFDEDIDEADFIDASSTPSQPANSQHESSRLTTFRSTVRHIESILRQSTISSSDVKQIKAHMAQLKSQLDPVVSKPPKQKKKCTRCTKEYSEERALSHHLLRVHLKSDNYNVYKSLFETSTRWSI